MTIITAECVLRSRNAEAAGYVLSTLLLRYPRFIHAEVMTHRVFSRNAASSRAIPTRKQIAYVEDVPAIPLFWGADERGMQASAEVDDIERAKAIWGAAHLAAVNLAKCMADTGAHKQIVNRIIEPYSHITVLVSATEWDNFLEQRDHSAAEPHMQMLAREVRTALGSREPDLLRAGQWHLPFTDDVKHLSVDEQIKVSVARCASTSYRTVDGFDMTVDRAVALHDKLLASRPMHASPAEHVACADASLFNPVTGLNIWSNPEQHGNFTGFRQYRHIMLAS